MSSRAPAPGLGQPVSAQTGPVFDEDDSPIVAFETSPDDFLSIVPFAASGGGDPSRILTPTAERVPQRARIYWDKDI